MKECDIFGGGGGGQNILWRLLYIFRGSRPPNPQDLRTPLDWAVGDVQQRTGRRVMCFIGLRLKRTEPRWRSYTHLSRSVRTPQPGAILLPLRSANSGLRSRSVHTNVYAQRQQSHSIHNTREIGR